MWKDLTEAERNRWTTENDEREIRAIDEGVSRYKRSLEHVDLSMTRKRRVARYFETVEKAIADDQERMATGMASAGRPATWAPAYLTMAADKLAVIALQVLIRSQLGDRSHKLTVRANEIARLIRLEHELEEVIRVSKSRDKEERGFSKLFVEKIRGDEVKIHKLYKKMNDNKIMKWTPTQRLGIGTRLIQIVISCDIGFSLSLQRDGKKTSYHVEIDQKTLDDIARLEEDESLLSPRFSPMTCPPVKWSVVNGVPKGGYRMLPRQFVKSHSDLFTHGGNEMGSLETAMAAVNAIQDVEWMIDERILALAKRFFAYNNEQWSHLIPHATENLNLKPIDKGASKAELKIWRQHRQQQVEAHTSALSKRVEVAQSIHLATSLVGAPVFFPHEVDFRGRIYPAAPSRVSPQAGDLGKALLRYAEKVALGRHGLEDLKIWAAGCAGVDKVSFEDRIKWWNDNWGDKPDVDNDLRWTEYDDPFLFAQAAMEIADAIRSGRPETFMSNVSICVDGSQNGLQHLSAMGRDPIGGAAVNLIDSDVPCDLYGEVASLVYNSVIADADTLIACHADKDELGEPLPPIAWLERLEQPKARRKIVKRSVLAYPYGVTKTGMRDGLMADGFCKDLRGAQFRNAWYLAERIDESVRDVVIAAARLMDWFRIVAEITGKMNIPIDWVAPSGFPCRQRYLENNNKVVEVNSLRLTIKEPSEGDIIDRQAQIRAIVANFVHSIDASHLVMTCMRLVDSGYVSFQFIHDSYGCHAGRIRHLAAVLRQEFVKIHEKNLVQEFADNLKSRGIEVPPVPVSGNLDIQAVKTSKFFFA